MVRVDQLATPDTVVFYDGVCGLCTRFNQFLLRRDHQERLRFATLQGPFAQNLLRRYGKDPSDLDTIYVLADWQTPRERVLARSQGTLHALRQLDGLWGVAGRLGALVPVAIADAVYAFIAKRRYRLFGKFESCMIPPPEWRHRFLE
jgi:predicted DCC family thiol-disulfide oxidoreductase YuxK